ncbi:hypothetical protein [Actinophytocola sp.]|uniref:hypothetical protein n=1 Tax=Actinophytocola sp. TaxID=1872138 RepID=UPI003D6A2E71
MSGGQTVDTDELRAAAGAIADVVAPARRMEVRPAGASAYGHPTAHGAAERFCATWQIAVTVLGARAESGSKALRASADTYEYHETVNRARMNKVREQLDR